MEVFAFPKCPIELLQFPCIYLLWSARFVLKVSWDPSSVYYNSCSINGNRILLLSQLLEWKSTSFITIQRVNHIIAIMRRSIREISFPWNEDLFGVVNLPNNEVGLESMIHIELLVWHSPPCEVELLPGSYILSSGVESVMAFWSVELLLDVLSIVVVRDCSSDEGQKDCSLSQVISIFWIESLYYISTQHF